MGGTEINLKEKKVQVKIKEEEEEEEEERAKKKCHSEFKSFVLYFPTRRIENREVFISLCGQESSIIEQCLDTKCKVHRNPLVFP